MAKFFIDRPVFAWVIALFILLAGALSLLRLPVAQYPTIAPPAIQINAMYPGATAKTVDELKKLNLPAGVDITIKI